MAHSTPAQVNLSAGLRGGLGRIEGLGGNDGKVGAAIRSLLPPDAGSKVGFCVSVLGPCPGEELTKRLSAPEERSKLPPPRDQPGQPSRLGVEDIQRNWSHHTSVNCKNSK